MVEDREIKMKRFLERNTSMHTVEIDQLFEYKENESDAMIRNLNSLGAKNTERSALQSLDDLSLDDSDNKLNVRRKRKQYDTMLVGRESGIYSASNNNSNDSQLGSQNRQYEPNYRSKRMKEYDGRTASSERRWY